MGLEFTVTKIQKVLVDMEESAGKEFQGSHLRVAENLWGLKFRGHIVWKSHEGSFEDLRASEGLEVRGVQKSLRVQSMALKAWGGGSLICRLSDPASVT